MKNRINRINRGGREMGLGPVVVISAFIHIAFFAFLWIFPAIGMAKAPDRPKAIVFNLEVADRIGSGVGGVPKKGPEHDGKIELPPPEVALPPEPDTAPAVKMPDLEPNKKPEPRKKKTPTRRSDPISDALRDAVREYNEGREGDFTRPDGDPNSENPGPAGAPGGDSCAVYRSRSTRHIRRSGSVPEAAGKSVSIAVTVSPSGAVSSKRITRSSGVPAADRLALGMVPRSFGAPPPECGSVRIRVTVQFQGSGRQGQQNMPERQDRKPKKKKSTVPSAVDRALQDL